MTEPQDSRQRLLDMIQRLGITRGPLLALARDRKRWESWEEPFQDGLLLRLEFVINDLERGGKSWTAGKARAHLARCLAKSQQRSDELFINTVTGEQAPAHTLPVAERRAADFRAAVRRLEASGRVYWCAKCGKRASDIRSQLNHGTDDYSELEIRHGRCNAVIGYYVAWWREPDQSVTAQEGTP